MAQPVNHLGIAGSVLLWARLFDYDIYVIAELGCLLMFSEM